MGMPVTAEGTSDRYTATLANATTLAVAGALATLAASHMVAENRLVFISGLPQSLQRKGRPPFPATAPAHSSPIYPLIPATAGIQIS